MRARLNRAPRRCNYEVLGLFAEEVADCGTTERLLHSLKIGVATGERAGEKYDLAGVGQMRMSERENGRVSV